MSFALICVVGALLAGWIFLRRRRIAAAAARECAFASHASMTTGRPVLAHKTTRPSLAQLGLNALGKRLLACNVVALLVGVLFFSGRGLAIDWSTAWPSAVLLAAILVVWLNFYFVPGPPRERFVAEVLFVTFLMLLLTNVLVPMQYGALAMGAPYADSWLASTDAALGVHVPALAAWTRLHPLTSRLATVTYFTFAPQMLLTVFALAVMRDRERLWEFAFHFHLCLVVTIAALAVWPAICPPAHYGFAPTIDMTRTIAQIRGFHDGSMTLVRFDDLDGLVSIPSFHVAGAILVTWAFRHRRRILIPLVVLNSALAISAVITGVHYAVDVLAAVPLVAGSMAVFVWWGRPLLTVEDLAPQSKAA